MDISLLYLLSIVFFIYGIKMLSHPKTARNGNIVASAGMAIAIIATIVINLDSLRIDLLVLSIIIGSVLGIFLAVRVKMTQMPQLVAIFNGFGGGASALVAYIAWVDVDLSGSFEIIVISLGIIVGSLTFSGSFIACGKLHGFISDKPILMPARHVVNIIILLSLLASITQIVYPGIRFIDCPSYIFYYIILGSLVLGITLTIPIGGADMPVVISLLNSYSGVAAALTGFIIIGSQQSIGHALIISGSLVGASGIILTSIMCKGMNRSLSNVIFGAVGSDTKEVSSSGSKKQVSVKSYSTEEAALIFDAADKVIIVPGYGLAVAQAQHIVKEFADLLISDGKEVLYAIHPVAGRMPGHMNVLLAEANIPYEQLKDLDEINSEFEDCDIALVLGANDVVNPSARHDESSPIFGMPILNVDKSRTVIINKRSMNTGFAGIENELFGYENSIMVFDDAKKMLNSLVSDYKDL
tara:strand:+ start:1062 stop:2468 length:1407 start_codon:yes stop_codon:yes gene_type:complete